MVRDGNRERSFRRMGSTETRGGMEWEESQEKKSSEGEGSLLVQAARL